MLASRLRWARSNAVERFDYLSRQTSDSCNLQASGLAGMSAGGRFLGSCCRPMVYEQYVKQVRGLSRYQSSLIPRDPYDISVKLAARLVAFNEEILLTAKQQQVYNKATRLATLLLLLALDGFRGACEEPDRRAGLDGEAGGRPMGPRGRLRRRPGGRPGGMVA